jgi:hypothetical protein
MSPQFNKEHMQDFFSNPVWFRILELLRERKEVAVSALLDSSKDPERDIHRADYNAAIFIETIPKVISQELEEE